jgi:hypothetical protein
VVSDRVPKFKMVHADVSAIHLVLLWRIWHDLAISVSQYDGLGPVLQEVLKLDKRDMKVQEEAVLMQSEDSEPTERQRVADDGLFERSAIVSSRFYSLQPFFLEFDKLGGAAIILLRSLHERNVISEVVKRHRLPFLPFKFVFFEGCVGDDGTFFRLLF